MSSKVEYVQGEAVKVQETTDFIDRAIEGSDVHYVTATDTDGNSGRGGGRSYEQARDNAVFDLQSKRD